MIALVCGAAASGKSACAEQLALQLHETTVLEAKAAPQSCPLIYLATMLPVGEEAARRIERHRAARAHKGFTTLEVPCGLVQLAHAIDAPECTNLLARTHQDESVGLDENATVLLEDLGNLVANEMFPGANNAASSSSAASTHSLPCARSTEDAKRAVLEGIAALAQRCAHVVVVGNEVGDGGEDLSAEVRRYQEVLGECACVLAARSRLVIECVAGVEHILKGARL